jgi:hypothetical protein
MRMLAGTSLARVMRETSEASPVIVINMSLGMCPMQSEEITLRGEVGDNRLRFGMASVGERADRQWHGAYNLSARWDSARSRTERVQPDNGVAGGRTHCHISNGGGKKVDLQPGRRFDLAGRKQPNRYALHPKSR